MFLVLFRAKRGDCTQGCVYFVYLYTLGAKEAPTLARGKEHKLLYLRAGARKNEQFFTHKGYDRQSRE